MLDWISIFSKDEQLQKAFSPILVTLAGIVIFDNFEQPMKSSDSISSYIFNKNCTISTLLFLAANLIGEKLKYFLKFHLNCSFLNITKYIRIYKKNSIEQKGK